MQVVVIQKKVFAGAIVAGLVGGLLMSPARAAISSIIGVTESATGPIRRAHTASVSPSPGAHDPAAAAPLFDAQRIQRELDAVDSLLPRSVYQSASGPREPDTLAARAGQARLKSVAGSSGLVELAAYDELRDDREAMVRAARSHVAREIKSARRARSSLCATAPLSFPAGALSDGNRAGFATTSSRRWASDYAEASLAKATVLRTNDRRLLPAQAVQFHSGAQSLIERDYHQLRNGYAGGYDHSVFDTASHPFARNRPSLRQTSAFIHLSACFSLSRPRSRPALRNPFILFEAPDRMVRARTFGENI